MNSMAEYKCEICNATFNTKGELETHKNKHMTKRSGCGCCSCW